MFLCLAHRKSPIVNSGPSLEDQMKRLQEDKAGKGSGLTRRRSCSMHRLYNMTKMNSKPGRGLRLRKASDGNTEEIEVSLLSASQRAHVDPSGLPTKDLHACTGWRPCFTSRICVPDKSCMICSGRGMQRVNSMNVLECILLPAPDDEGWRRLAIVY